MHVDHFKMSKREEIGIFPRSVHNTAVLKHIPVNNKGYPCTDYPHHDPSIVQGLAEAQNTFGMMKSRWLDCFLQGRGGDTKWSAFCPCCFCLSAQRLHECRRHLWCKPDACDPEAPSPPGSETMEGSHFERRNRPAACQSDLLIKGRMFSTF